MESLSAAAGSEKRFLSVNICSKERLAFTRIDTYCEIAPVFRNGFPVTTKSGAAKHGYGMRSIDATVACYDGEWSASTENSIFSLRVFLPIQDTAGPIDQNTWLILQEAACFSMLQQMKQALCRMLFQAFETRFSGAQIKMKFWLFSKVEIPFSVGRILNSR